MTSLEDRQQMSELITQACNAGARLAQACELCGLSESTLQRWRSRATGAVLGGDQRPHAHRSSPSHALSEAERAELLRVANEPRFADLPPARIVPLLADEGRYLASESSFARVLRQAGQNAHRSRSRAPRAQRPPTTHIATASGQVWCWDMTYLPATVAGRWFYLYLIVDLYSRKVVDREVHAEDDSDHAARLVQRTALAEGIAAQDSKPVLHGDNGATLKATTVLAMLHWLGVNPSYSRPRVSDDNAFVEALFRTAKYRPEYPKSGYEDLSDARAWAARFVRWYNLEHRHSGIRYLTPAQRHSGQDVEILKRRDELYQRARQCHPARWARHTRNWDHIAVVKLNPERDSEPIAALASALDKAPRRA